MESQRKYEIGEKGRCQSEGEGEGHVCVEDEGKETERENGREGRIHPAMDCSIIPPPLSSPPPSFYCTLTSPYFIFTPSSISLPFVLFPPLRQTAFLSLYSKLLSVFYLIICLIPLSTPPPSIYPLSLPPSPHLSFTPLPLFFFRLLTPSSCCCMYCLISQYVINYSFPLTVEDYVHRIGRTGRGGATGISHTFFTDFDKVRK